jgi:alkanesulfonate monooxygenase SsuD/methylene tetrahydromethanopterin reductase-like flavin-dependent oxidoreductase (luciferase family)
MADYGHELRFGVMLEPEADWGRAVPALAELTEQVGLDLVSLADHPYWTDRLDAMTLLTAIAARTSRVTLFPNLANLPLRDPLMLARAAATLDTISGGRFELGLGPGVQRLWEQIVADGGPRRSAGESVAALEEAIAIVRASWAASGPVQFDGAHYRLAAASGGPAPAHDVGIWVGAYRRRMLQLAGWAADGWVSSSPAMPPEQLAAANLIIDEAAVAAERSPRDVLRVYNIEGTFGEPRPGFLQGPPRVWVQQLTDLALSQGISGFVLFRVGSADLIKQFAAEVAPAVRQSVAAERAAAVVR